MFIDQSNSTIPGVLGSQGSSRLVLETSDRPISTSNSRIDSECRFDVYYSDFSDFSQLLSLRAKAYGNSQAGLPEPIDFYSYHVVARVRNQIVGALRATCRKHGPLESEKFYPQWILDQFGDQMCAGSRLCVDRSMFSQELAITIELGRIGYKTVLTEGVRLDASKARVRAIPLHLRMGYLFLRDSFFEFENWKQQCGIIVYPADPHRLSPLQNLFIGLDNINALSAFHDSSQFISSVKEFKHSLRGIKHAKSI